VIATNDQIGFMLNKLNLRGSTVFEIPIGSNIGPVDSLRIDKKKLRKELDISQNTLVLSHFGLFYPGKGLETLLEACKILLPEKSDFILLLIGSRRKEDKHYLARIDNLINEYNLKERVHFTGFLKEVDVIRHLCASDIYVVPYDEGASTRRGSLIAGFIHGLPIISTFPMIPNQYFFDDTNILFVHAHDSKALASRILALYKDPEKRAHLGKQALQTARHFSWEEIGDETIRTFYSSLRPK
jgi:glycosyltransferase involved in cell wall biosynthesis